jgi:hypothetical protein
MSKSKKNAEGIKKLAIWMAAESKAVAVLDILVENNTITADVKILNLKACTNALLKEEKWEAIFATARAHSSNDSQIKSSQQKKEKLFKWLNLNLKNYKTLDEAAHDACENQVVHWGFDQIRRMITLYRKEKLNGK